MKSKLLIFGGSGLVGRTLANFAKNNYDLHLTYHENVPPFSEIPNTKIDFIKETSELENFVKTINPDYVVQTVAYPSMDFCEKNPDMARTLHVKAVQEIANACSELKTKLISFSTDAVFDGKSNSKYTELDKPNPLSHYGRTKLEGENVVLKTSNENVVLRTTVIYGWQKQSRFTSWVMNSIKNKQKVTAFIDQNNTPTLTDDLAKSILKIIDKKTSGLFHATGKTCLSRYEFAIKLAEKFNLDKKFISSVKAAEFNQLGPRPKNGCLDSFKLEKEINYQFKDIDEGISYIFKKLN